MTKSKKKKQLKTTRVFIKVNSSIKFVITLKSSNSEFFVFLGEEEINAVMTLNTGCRESGQNWKLPPVEEENLHLYCSDA
jgi:hypothetical protein